MECCLLTAVCWCWCWCREMVRKYNRANEIVSLPFLFIVCVCIAVFFYSNRYLFFSLSPGVYAFALARCCLVVLVCLCACSAGAIKTKTTQRSRGMVVKQAKCATRGNHGPIQRHRGLDVGLWRGWRCSGPCELHYLRAYVPGLLSVCQMQ